MKNFILSLVASCLFVAFAYANGPLISMQFNSGYSYGAHQPQAFFDEFGNLHTIVVDGFGGVREFVTPAQPSYNYGYGGGYNLGGGYNYGGYGYSGYRSSYSLSEFRTGFGNRAIIASPFPRADFFGGAALHGNRDFFRGSGFSRSRTLIRF